MDESADLRTRRIQEALALLRPYDIAGAEKIRLGREMDGGYVMLAGHSLPSVLYSFGIGDEISFEYDLALRGCHSHLFDHTINGLPYQHPNLHF
jgi:hypothetical protein